MSRNRSIAKRMGGEHTRTPKAGDKSYAKVLFSPDEMASFESLMNEVDDVGVGGKFIKPRFDANADAAPTSSWRDWCTGLNVAVLVVLVVTAVVAVDFTKSYFPSAMAADARARVDTTLEATPAPSPAARALAADLSRAARQADPAARAALEGRRDALVAAGSGTGFLRVAEPILENGGGDASGSNAKRGTRGRAARGDKKDAKSASNSVREPPEPSEPANATASREERKGQVARDLADALTNAMDATVSRAPPPPPAPRDASAENAATSPPDGVAEARAARDAADTAEADAADARSREARHEAAETDEERRERHAREDEERRARHEKEDRERAEKHAMEDELRELRAAARAKEPPETLGVEGDANADGFGVSVADTLPTTDGDVGDVDDAPADGTDPVAPTDPTLPEPLDDFPGDDDAVASPSRRAAETTNAPETNATDASVPYEPGDGASDARVEDDESAEPEAATTPRRAGAAKKKKKKAFDSSRDGANETAASFSTRNGADDASADAAVVAFAETDRTTDVGFDDDEDAFGPTAATDAPIATTATATANGEPPEEDAAAPASLAEAQTKNAPGLPGSDSSSASFSEGAAITDPPADYDHASLRVGVDAARANETVADAGGEPARAANETAPEARARESGAASAKGLVREPTDGGAPAPGSRGAEPEPP